MTPAAVPQVTALLDQVDRLKALHRAGEVPTFGQVEALFDQAVVVRAALQAPAADPRAVAWPTSAAPRAVEQAARLVGHALLQALATLQAGSQAAPTAASEGRLPAREPDRF